MAQMCLATFIGHNPGALDPGRVMTHMLVVPAGQAGDPVTLLVEMVTDDGLIECGVVHGILTTSPHRS